MSSTIWTAEELLSKAQDKKGTAWRLTESQSVNSTLKLVDDLEEQDILEKEIDNLKPPYAEGTEDLHYLLKTPFRYSPSHNNASRYREKNHKSGAFYAASTVETALAELAFHTLRFFIESPNTQPPQTSISKTAFSIKYKTDKALNLCSSEFDDIRENIEDTNNYSYCQQIANFCREAKIELIQSNSVRCPNKGENITILNQGAFDCSKPLKSQSWNFFFKESSVIATREIPREKIEFPFEIWANDTRVSNYMKDK